MKSTVQYNEKLVAELNSYFDKIYLLTIERNRNRVAACRENLKGVDFSIFIGADGRELSLTAMEKAGEYDSALLQKNVNREMIEYIGRPHDYVPVPNMVACALSHKMIYQDVISNSYKRVLILEDDAVLLTKNLPSFLAMTQQLPSEWHVLYLGYHWKYDHSPFERLKRLYLYPIIQALGLRKYNTAAVTKGFAQPYSKNLLKAGTHAGTHAYAMTTKGAEIMLRHQSPIQNNPDLAFWEPIMQGELKAYSAAPILFEVVGENSSILES